MNVDGAARHAVRALSRPGGADTRGRDVGSSRTSAASAQALAQAWCSPRSWSRSLRLSYGSCLRSVRRDRNHRPRFDPPAGVTTEQIQAGWTRLPNVVAYRTFVHQAVAGRSAFVAVGDSCVPGCPSGDPTIPAIWYSPDHGAFDACRPRPSVERDECRRGYLLARRVLGGRRRRALRSGPRPMDGCGRHNRARRWRCLAAGRGKRRCDWWPTDFGLFARTQVVVLSSRPTVVPGRPPTFPARSRPRSHGSVAHLVALVGPAGGSRVQGARWCSPHTTASIGAAAPISVRVDPGSITVTTWRHELWAVSYPSRGANASLIWRSPDGSSWSHPDVPFSPPGTVFDQLIPIGPYLVATGFDTNSRPGGWVTTDGSHWIPMPDLRRPPGGRLDIATSNSDALVSERAAQDLTTSTAGRSRHRRSRSRPPGPRSASATSRRASRRRSARPPLRAAQRRSNTLRPLNAAKHKRSTPRTGTRTPLYGSSKSAVPSRCPGPAPAVQPLTGPSPPQPTTDGRTS